MWSVHFSVSFQSEQSVWCQSAWVRPRKPLVCTAVVAMRSVCICLWGSSLCVPKLSKLSWNCPVALLHHQGSSLDLDRVCQTLPRVIESSKIKIWDWESTRIVHMICSHPWLECKWAFWCKKDRIDVWRLGAWREDWEWQDKECFLMSKYWF